MRSVKILIISHSEILKIGMKYLIEKLNGINGRIILSSHSSTTEEIIKESPDIILLDPMDAGRINTAEIKEESATKIIALYHSALPKEMLSRFDSSISIYDDITTISKVIEDALQTENEEEDSKVLSQREKEVIVGIVKGLSNKEIAAEINVSVNTVMTHRRNIASKLRIHSPAGLTIYAIVSKLVRLDEIQSQLPR